jgi:ribosomal protein S18 acetylase RimI-like enzyme
MNLIESNNNNLLAYIAEKAKLTVVQKENVKWVLSTPFKWPNFIFDTKLPAANLEEFVNETVQHIEQKQAPSLWMISAENLNSDFISLLDNNSLRLSMQWTGMMCDLSKFQNPDNIEPFKIIQVNGLAQLQDWLSIINQTLFNSANSLDFDLFKLFLNDNNIKLYTGYYNNIPVATSLMFLHTGVAGLYMISTLPEYRKKGLGTLITTYPMLDAKAMGLKTSVLYATSMGKNMYKTIGFEEHEKMNIFWKVGKEFR